MRKTVFRDYDIRGIVGSELTAADIQLLGHNFAQEVKKLGQSKIAVGRDVRLSSGDFSIALIEGITMSGVCVVDFGIITTPALYYLTTKQGIKNAAMVTASHNPKEYNGLKLMLDGSPLFGENLNKLYSNKKFQFIKNSETANTSIHSIDPYSSDLLSAFDFSNSKHKLKIAIDLGNGAMCEIMKQVVKSLPTNCSIINDSPNGSFPSHDPDISDSSNLTELYKTIARNSCDLGFAFDCDGDRIAILRSSGALLRGDEILYLIASNAKNRDGTIVVDIKTSFRIISELKKLGYNIIVSRTGNPYIKKSMNENNATFGAELSGHIMFRKWLNIDDAAFAMFSVLKILSSRGLSILNKIPQLYRTNEIKIVCKDKILTQTILNDYIQSNKMDSDIISLLDGIKLQNKLGTILIRTANSEDILSLIIEGNSRDSLASLRSYANEIFAKLNLDVSTQ